MQWLRTQNIIILRCFPLDNGPRCLRVLLISPKYPQYLSHLDLNTAQSIPVQLVQITWPQSRWLHFSRVQFIVHLVQNSASSSMQSSTTRSSPRYSFPYGRVHRHKASADSRYRYNSLMDGKAWWRKGPTFHWVFSSLPLCCIRGGWEQIS